MHPTASHLLLLLVAAAAALALTAGACVPRERDALLAFKDGVTADPARRLASWRPGSDCCRWRGVRCSNLTGHVTALRLRPTPPDTALVGHISPSLLSLEHLEHLDLSSNSLNEPDHRFPEFLGSLKSLRYLNLSGIAFNGRLPPQLGNLSNLHYLDLDLSDWERSSDFASTDLSWLTRLQLLRYLDLSGANLSMVSDWAHVVNMIPSLRVLHLSGCELKSANQSLPLLNLTKLERLDLSWNQFNHESASCWFWRLTSLMYLGLKSTGLSGQIPDALATLTSLQVFDFSLNDNMGIMTPSLLWNLSNLEILNLELSLSSGNMTELFDSLLQSLFTSKLRELYLRQNNMSGALPTNMGRFTSLIILDLAVNHLTGHVPFEIGMLTNLTELYLEFNDLEGVITEEHFAGLHSLTDIALSNNHLNIVLEPEWSPPFKLVAAYFASCHLGPKFPAWLQGLAGVDHLDISNAGITDHFPDWFSMVFSNATYLDVSNNGIIGNLPKNMEMIMSLYELNLASNQITGQIPLLPRNLGILDISNNSLSGPLPSKFGALALGLIFLTSNNLSGHIPDSICEMQKLALLDLANNHFEGEFPQCSETTEMSALVLRNNSFSGMFPSFLRGCTQLRILDLSHNKLRGKLPMWIGDLVELQYLRLSHNLFHGNIPSNITNLRNLYHLNFADNKLSGVIPSRLSKLTSMILGSTPITRMVWERQWSDHLSVVTKRQELYYGWEIVYVVSIDLSLNCLTGGIPEGIASLALIRNLNLSFNFLSGKIPNKIGSLKLLESLDLSWNKLSGEIPPSISNLTSLSCLDLSYNNLSGRIPSGSQLDSLYTENSHIYSGNDGLCGPPLQRNCSGSIASNQGDNDHKRTSDQMLFQLGLASGFIVGLWVVFCIMLFKKTWRIAYFNYFNNFCDKIYVFVAVTCARLARQNTSS